MPEYLAPGSYVQELSWGPTIEPAETSVTALVGPASAGPWVEPVRIHSLEQARDVFGRGSWLAQALEDYFANGGQVGLGVRTGAQRDDALAALATADPFQLLVCDARAVDLPAAYAVAVRRRAFLLVDAADGELPEGLGGNAAAYYPRLRDERGGLRDSAPAVAGVHARTDASRGVWKAAAASGAVVHGATGLEVSLSDLEAGTLTQAKVNALREHMGDVVVWGARTASDDPEWRYVPVRRMALFLEESLARGLEWAVFEPNDERLWARLRSAIQGFLDGLWRQGAFQGTRPAEAYAVHCGRDIMSQADLDEGRVVVLVGFAPISPAEFVVLQVVLRTGSAPSS